MLLHSKKDLSVQNNDIHNGNISNATELYIPVKVNNIRIFKKVIMTEITTAVARQ